jgi:hypothetical protein
MVSFLCYFYDVHGASYIAVSLCVCVLYCTHTLSKIDAETSACLPDVITRFCSLHSITNAVIKN